MRIFVVWLFLMSAAFAFAQTQAPYPIPVSSGAIGWAGLPGTFSGPGGCNGQEMGGLGNVELLSTRRRQSQQFPRQH